MTIAVAKIIGWVTVLLTLATGMIAAEDEISANITEEDSLSFAVTVVPINEVQGLGDESPLQGESVTVEAVVVGDFQNEDDDSTRNLNGFFLQEEDDDADGDDSTSEGIFVFEDSSMITDVQLGDLVQVTGVVNENFGQTQILALNVTVLSSDNPLPTPAVITLPLPTLEAFEGMRVSISNTMHITEMYNLDRFNEIRLHPNRRPYQFTQLNMPDPEGFAAHLQELSENVITYEDGLSTQNEDISLLDGFGPVYNTATSPRMGDTIVGLAGVLEYSFSRWRVRSAVNNTNTFQKANPRPNSPTDVVGDSDSEAIIKMTSFNVLNFFDTLDMDGATTGPSGLEPRGADTQEEYDRQLEKLTTIISMMDADLLGLLELENDFGESEGDDCALKSLVDAVNDQAGDGTYAYVWPGRRYVDAGDAISVGFMYKPSVLTLVGTPAILNDDNLPDGAPDPPVFDGVSTNRASLALSFTHRESGGCITVAGNHFKSKGGEGEGEGNPDSSDGAGNWNQRRLDGAKAVDLWMQMNPTGYQCSNKVILGDLNAYAMEDPIQYLEQAGYFNVEEPTEFSYVFDGQVGSLDYIMLNSNLTAKVTGSAVWHINEDEADAIDYNLDYGRLPTYFDGTSPARASDHSPVLVGLDLALTEGEQTGTESNAGEETVTEENGGEETVTEENVDAPGGQTDTESNGGEETITDENGDEEAVTEENGGAPSTSDSSPGPYMWGRMSYVFTALAVGLAIYF